MTRIQASTLSSLLGIGASFEGEGAEYVAYPNLRDIRWLFPAGQRTLLRSGIEELFKPGSLKGRVFKMLLSRGAVPGERVFLEKEGLSRLEEELARAFGGTKPGVAFYVGVPGAYRKVTALVMGPGGETLAFAKMATAPLAVSDVEAEQRTLSRLSEAPGLRGRVPGVLRHLDWQGGKILLITGGPKRPGPTELSSAHLEFLKDLFLPFAEWGAFDQSPMFDRMSRKLSAIRQARRALPDGAHAALGRSLERLHGELGSVRLPLSLTHRDFAPWNTRLGPDGLFVFDWDRAEYATPLYDAFHFRAIQTVLLNRRGPAPERELMRGLLEDVWPEGRDHLSRLYLAYLLDMCLVYGEARAVAPEAGDDRVLGWFVDRIGDFLEHGSPLE